jgi:hypothetical protein
MRFEPSVPGLEPAFDVEVRLGPLADYGPTRAGHRRVIPVVGGTVTGGIEGEILPGGADWQTVRDDGTIDIDGRYSIRTTAGELIYLQVRGVRSGPRDVVAALLEGRAVDPSEYYFRTIVHLETSAPRLASWQQAIFVASCVRDSDAVRYRAYRLT